MTRRLSAGALALALAAAPAVAAEAGEERTDHRGSLGLTVATGGEFVGAGEVRLVSDPGLRMPVEVGGTAAVGEHLEARLAARVGLFGPELPFSFYAGVRSSYGYSRTKSFFDLDLAFHRLPRRWFLGARVAAGVQYDFLPVMGAFASVGGQLAFGQGMRLSFEVLVGLQFRTYVFE